MGLRTMHAVNSATFTPPPIDGSLTLPEIFDYHRTHSPNHPLYHYDDAGTLQTISWSKAARAVDAAARLVYSLHLPETSQVVAILANADMFTHFALIVGIMRAGLQPFLISSRNSPAVIAHLLEKTKAKCMFITGDPSIQRLTAAVRAHPLVAGMIRDSLKLLPMPTFDSLFGVTDKVFEPLPPLILSITDLALIMHTSGSMAFPKLVPFTFRAIQQWGMIPYYGERDLCGEVLSSHSYPISYAMSILTLSWTTSTGMVLSNFSPSNTPLTASPERIMAEIIATKTTLLFCVPSLIEIWSHDPQSFEQLKKFHVVAYGGAPIDRAIGDRLVSEGVQLAPFYGATEFGGLVVFTPKGPCKEDWEYFKVSPQVEPFFTPQGDNVFQLLIMDGPTLTPNVINANVNGRGAYDTYDLLVQHPTNPDLWRVYGRIDEQLMHSSGEKTNPVPIEAMLVRHPMIRGAVMFGTGHVQAGIIIDPAPEYLFDKADKGLLDRYLNSIWPLIEEINDRSPTHSRIFKDMVIISNPSKPFEYTPKATPRRKYLQGVYAEEIEAAYAAAEESSKGALTAPEVWEKAECLNFARNAVQKVMPGPLGDDDDFFQSGCDSIQATWVRHAILDALRRSAKTSTRSIPRNFVYANPTVRRLGTYITQIVHYGQSSVALSMSSGKIAEMEGLVRKYTTQFPPHRPMVINPKKDCILITGTTGFLGPHLLAQLTQLPDLEKIYALNRKEDRSEKSLRERQVECFRDHGLDVKILDSEKIVLLEGDLTLEYFELGKELYSEVQNSITCILHNAWSMDFNVCLSTMEPLIAGTRNLIDFALGSPHVITPRLAFISSLGIFNNWTQGSAAPEALNHRPATAIGAGYTESKWIAESVIIKAAETTSMQPVIIRVGHICGSNASGSWNHESWIPAMIKSAQVLGYLPRANGHITWLPVDYTAKIIVEMKKSNDLFLNLLHPNPVHSDFVFDTLAELLDVPIVSYSEWLMALEASRNDSPDSAVAAAIRNPALTLFDHYRSVYRPHPKMASRSEDVAYPSTSMDNSMAASPFLKEIPQLSRRDIEGWVRHWRKTGFLI